MKKPALFLGVFALFMIIKGLIFPEKWFNMGYVHWKTEITYGILTIIFAMLMSAAWDRWKYNTVQFVAHGLSGSFYKGDSARVGNWFVTSLGGIDVKNFNDKGRESTVVVPMPSIRYRGGNVTANVVPKRCSLNSLPRDVKNYVEENDLPTHKIYFGTIPDKIEETNNTYVDFERMYKDLNEMKNQKEMMKSEIMTDTRDIVRWRKQIGDTSIKGTIERKFDKLSKDNGEE